jgi:ELWxxDGT repeat protein
MRRLALALLLAALPCWAWAQAPALVADVNPHPPGAGAAGSDPRQFAAAGGRAVYITREGDPAAPSYLLWATDGSAAGTSALVRLCAPCAGEPQQGGSLPGLAFYATQDVSTAQRLWRTDGTRAGTFPVTPPLSSLYAAPGSTLGRRLLFEACDAAGSCGLWTTDGSAAGTRILQGSHSTGTLVVGTGKAFFTTEDGLWATDGTPQGTKRVSSSSYAAYLTVSGSRAFFLAGGDDYPEDLWTSDGTAGGTRFLRRFAQPNHYQSPYTSYLKPVPGGVALVGISGGTFGINLWRSDGTPEGTRQLTSFQGLQSLGGLRDDQIAAAGDRLFFVVDGVTGPRLWSSQGSAATTRPVTGCPGGCPAVSPDSPLVPLGNRVVLAARDLAHGTEPWTSDGTGAGTHILRDLCPGACDSNPESFTAHAGTLDFRASWNGQTRLVRTDGTAAAPLAPVPPPLTPPVSYPPRLDLADVGPLTVFAGLDSAGAQPWETDGTAPGSRRIVSGATSGGSDPRDLVALGNRLLFTADDGAERSVWVVDAQREAAPLPATAVPSALPGPSALTVSGGLAYFLSDRGTDGTELWRTDGTPAGTLRLAAFQGKSLSDLRDLGGRLVFLVTSTVGEQPVFAFWGSDGTPAGTVQRLGFPSDTVAISAVTALGAELYFVLDSETAEWIYRGDGTAAGTRPVLQAACDCLYFVGQTFFVRAGGGVYFTAPGQYGIFLYRTDGTAAGTVPVLPAADATDTPNPLALFTFQGDLYFFGFNPDTGSPTQWILYRLPAGASAAIPLKTVGFQPYDPVAPEFTVLDGRLYFRAWDPAHGFELWRTDGTSAGTVLVRDLAPGTASGDPRGLVAAGGRLWFSALDPDHGRELWTSDGTRQGTRRVTDLAPGVPSSAPEQLTPVAGRLFFTADDGASGREPWRLDLIP